MKIKIENLPTTVVKFSSIYLLSILSTDRTSSYINIISSAEGIPIKLTNTAKLLYSYYIDDLQYGYRPLDPLQNQKTKDKFGVTLSRGIPNASIDSCNLNRVIFVNVGIRII